MICELENVILAVDLPEYQLKTGDIGTVVMIYGKGAAYDVEFVATDGTTIALKRLMPEQIKSASDKRQVYHVRELV